jgi:Effector Associated Constant Component 1
MLEHGDRPLELSLVLQPAPGAGAEEAERLGRRLRDELRGADLWEVEAVPGPPPPPGARAVDAASLTELLVTLSAGGGVFVTVLATVRDWLGRQGGGHSIKVTIDGDTLELTNASAADSARLMELFVDKHRQV